MDDIPKDFNNLEVIESCYNTTKPQMGKASNMLMVLLSHSVSRDAMWLLMSSNPSIPRRSVRTLACLLMASVHVTCTKAVWVTAGWLLPSPAWPQSRHCGRRCCTWAIVTPSCTFPCLHLRPPPPARWSPITLIRSGIRSIPTCTQESFISGSGGSVVGWTSSWTTVFLSAGTERCSSAAQPRRGSSGALCWKRPTPSKLPWIQACPHSGHRHLDDSLTKMLDRLFEKVKHWLQVAHFGKLPSLFMSNTNM